MIIKTQKGWPTAEVNINHGKKGQKLTIDHIGNNFSGKILIFFTVVNKSTQKGKKNIIPR